MNWAKSDLLACLLCRHIWSKSAKKVSSSKGLATRLHKAAAQSSKEKGDKEMDFENELRNVHTERAAPKSILLNEYSWEIGTSLFVGNSVMSSGGIKRSSVGSSNGVSAPSTAAPSLALFRCFLE